MKTTTVRVEDRSRMDPAKVLSVRLDDLLRVLDKAADHFVIPCYKCACKNCSALIADDEFTYPLCSQCECEGCEAPFGAKSKNEAKTEAKNRKRIK